MSSYMNHLDNRDTDAPCSTYDATFQWQTMIVTAAILLMAYYVWPLLSYETTIKRTLYDLTVPIFPVRLVDMVARGASMVASLPQTTPSARNIAAPPRTAAISSIVHSARRLSGFDKYRPPLPEATYAGLGNWDNSCFQNSVLQGLASLPAFSEFAKTTTELLAQADIQAPTFDGLDAFLQQLQSERQGRHTLWPPAVLRSMNTWQQQDAQEYYSKIMDSVEKESARYLTAVTRRSAPSLTCLRPSASGSELSYESSLLSMANRLPFSSSLINPVEGTLSQTLRCQNCGYSEGLSMMPFNCLTLNLGLAGGRYLEDLIDSYTEAELIDGVECENCTAVTNSVSGSVHRGGEAVNDLVLTARDSKKKVFSTKAKRIQFGKLPPNLVIHLNRSIYDQYGTQRKNAAFIQIPERLEIVNDWVASLGGDEPDIHAAYELKCLVTHQGRHDNGHYVACGRRGKDWYSFNDEIVTKIDEESVLGRGHGFMIFYQMIEQVSTMQQAPSGFTTPQEMQPAAELLVQEVSSVHGGNKTLSSLPEPSHAQSAEPNSGDVSCLRDAEDSISKSQGSSSNRTNPSG